jgi:hypothetical protein
MFFSVFVPTAQMFGLDVCAVGTKCAFRRCFTSVGCVRSALDGGKNAVCPTLQLGKTRVAWRSEASPGPFCSAFAGIAVAWFLFSRFSGVVTKT